MTGLRAIAVAILIVGAFASDASAEVRRYALVVGANQGDAGETKLRYAEDDARRIAKILTGFGSFEAKNVRLLTAPDATGLDRALGRLEAGVKASGASDTVLLVFYSGHADAESLHLRGTRFSLAKLRKRLEASSASVRVLIVDACRSGAVTRVKGGRRGPAFKIDLTDRLDTRGMAILTSSAAGEDSQESDALRASFFTHFLASGLIGAADVDADGQVSLGEAFAFAANQTLVATASTVEGPQHPTYRLNLGGRQDLILTRPALTRGNYGLLRFPDPGHYVVRRRASRKGGVVGEIRVSAGKSGQLALAPGTYTVLRRAPSELSTGTFKLARGGVTAVPRATLSQVAPQPVAAKGMAIGDSASLDDAPSRWRFWAVGGARGGILAHDVAGQGALGGSVAPIWPGLVFELGLLYGQSGGTVDAAAVTSHELGMQLGIYGRLDLGPVELVGGVSTGVLWYGQRFSDARASRDGAAWIGGVDARLNVHLSGPWHLRFGAGAMLYSLRAGTSASVANPTLPVTWRVTGGLEVEL